MNNDKTTSPTLPYPEGQVKQLALAFIECATEHRNAGVNELTAELETKFDRTRDALQKAISTMALPQQGGEQTEEIAQVLWHRVAPDHHIEWSDETNKAEYRDAASAILHAVLEQGGEQADAAQESFLAWIATSDNPIRGMGDAEHPLPVTYRAGYIAGRAATLPQAGEKTCAAINPPEFPPLPDVPHPSQDAVWAWGCLTGWRLAQGVPQVGEATILQSYWVVKHADGYLNEQGNISLFSEEKALQFCRRPNGGYNPVKVNIILASPAGLGGAKAAPPVDVDALVNRFLGWKLPQTFAPDAGISFVPPAHKEWWPIGTNLLTADEAKAMFEYVLAGSTVEDTNVSAATSKESARALLIKCMNSMEMDMDRVSKGIGSTNWDPFIELIKQHITVPADHQPPSATNPDLTMKSFTIVDLTKEIHRVNPTYTLGAGGLAEALMPFLSSHISHKRR